MKRTCAALALVAVMLAGTPVYGQADMGELERERLELDIKRLEREAGWQADSQRWLPAASLLVAFSVAIYGVLRYFDERAVARRTRIEEGVAHNLERLIDQSLGSSSPSASAVAALKNLDGLAPAVDPASEAHRSRVTAVVTRMVRDDLTTFVTPHEARLPVICIENWEDFLQLVENDVDLCGRVVERYRKALRTISDASPQYVASVSRSNGRYEAQKGSLDAGNGELFPEVVAGFEVYARLLPSEAREKAKRDVSVIAPRLGPQLLAQ